MRCDAMEPSTTPAGAAADGEAPRRAACGRPGERGPQCYSSLNQVLRLVRAKVFLEFHDFSVRFCSLTCFFVEAYNFFLTFSGRWHSVRVQVPDEGTFAFLDEEFYPSVPANTFVEVLRAAEPKRLDKIGLWTKPQAPKNHVSK